jgi:hypothetical protein
MSGVLVVYLQVKKSSFNFLEMVSGKPLFMGKDEADQLKQIFKIRGMPNDQNYPDVVKFDEFKVNNSLTAIARKL